MGIHTLYKGVHTHYNIPDSIIKRNSNGFLTIKRPQVGRPSIVQLPTNTQPLPEYQIIREVIQEVLRRAEKPPEGLLAAFANWISETVKIIFGNLSANTEKNSVDTKLGDATLLSPIELAPKPKIEKSPTDLKAGADPVALHALEDLSLTTSDKVLTTTNVVKWGTIGAGLYGISPQIILPISVLTSLGSEIISFCSLPKDAHWLRKALSIPVLSKLIINYNPWVAKAFHLTSLFNLAQHSASKLAAIWKGFTTNPSGAIKASAVHLFNLASDTLFAAESLGLIDLSQKNKEDPLHPPGNPNTKADRFGPQDPVEIRRIKLATVYNNNGNIEREKISSIVTQNHAEYAQKWDLEHDIVTKDLVSKQCTNPKTTEAVNCSPYMNKIQYYRMQCQDPTQRGKWIIYGDDDLIYTNPNINPWTAIDLLRNGKDTSLILTTEEGDWGQRFEIPGHPTHDPRIAINSGFIIGRIDDAACDVFEKTWQHRNAKMNENHPNFDKCPTVAYCKNHGITSLGDQTAMAIALQDDPSVMDRTVTIIPSRDESAPHRAHIALNTLHRDGCHQGVLEDGSLAPPYDISSFDDQYPNGKWRVGDWNGQTAGFKLMGRYPLPKQNGQCIEDSSQPINIRLKKIQEMLAQKTKEQHFTVAMTYTPNRTGNPNEEYSDMTQANHRLFAKLNHADFALDTDPSKLQCEIPNSDPNAKKATQPCVSYWRKVDMIDRWLNESKKPGVEEWFVYADNDGIYADPNLDLYHVTKELQENKDASIIIAKDIMENVSLTNTGFIMVRKDAASRNFVNEWLETRNSPPHQPSYNCLTLGLCKNQSTSLHEQEAFNNLMSNPKLARDVSLVTPRDSRRSYGVNTFFRDGCFWRNEPEKEVRDIIEFNDQVKSAKGDLFVQAAGVPPRGVYCSNPSAPFLPIRKHYIQQMLQTLTVPPKHYPTSKDF